MDSVVERCVNEYRLRLSTMPISQELIVFIRQGEKMAVAPILAPNTHGSESLCLQSGSVPGPAALIHTGEEDGWSKTFLSSNLCGIL